MKEYYEILSNCPLFLGIEEKELWIMLQCLEARIVEFDKKYTIMHEGNEARYIGIVLSGSVQITQTDYCGNRSILNNIERSGVFAEAFACAETHSIPITVTANEPCKIMFIDCRRIMKTCTKSCSVHNRLIFNLMKNLAEKTILFHQKIEIISKRSTREKLLTYLALQSKKAGKRKFDIPFNRQELADYLEVDRSGLSAEISKLRNEGVLKNRKNHFELL